MKFSPQTLSALKYEHDFHINGLFNKLTHRFVVFVCVNVVPHLHKFRQINVLNKIQ